MAKKDGPTMRNLMDNKYWAVGYKWCNRMHIFFNIIILIIGAVLIYKYIEHSLKFITTEATIKSIEHDKCKAEKVMVRGKYGDHEETKYECVVNVEYKDDNGKSHSNKVTTDDKNHIVGDKIEIDYEKENPDKIYFRPNWYTYLFIFGVLFYIFTIGGTIVRVYYSDQEWAQFFISIGCLGDLFG